MNWFKFLYNIATDLRHSFGRGINASISPKEEELFNKSYDAFVDGDILDAYKFFFDSLKNYSDDKSNENIMVNREDDKLLFSIYQGSAKITGEVTKENLYAEVIIMKTSEAGVALKRYMLERNYQLTYAYYCSDSEYVKLKLHHDNIIASPQKIFFPLREIALNADFDKEYVNSEFKEITLQDIEHLVKIDAIELEIKYNFVQKWIEELEAKVKTLPTNDNAGMQAFLYLNILFKIDYLLVPKCKIYKKISKKIQVFFEDDGNSTQSKNEELKNYIDKLKDMSFEDFSKNFYNAKYTFNPMEESSHEDIANFISESLLKIRWYKNNRYNHVIPTIYNYISFYILYNYGLNPVVKSLIHTLVQVQNSEFFKALDYDELYDEKSKSFSKKIIMYKVDEAIVFAKERYKSLDIFADKLNFSSINEFSNSFLIQLKHLNFEEIS